MSVTIRPACERDAHSMIAMLNPILESGQYSALDGAISVEAQLAFLREFPQRGVILVAVCDDSREIIGMQDIQPFSSERAWHHVGEISTFVALGSQRLGIGRQLMDASTAAASDCGFQKLMATVRADNPQAVSFYESLNFRRIGTARNHACVRGQLIDEVLLERLLTES